MRIEPHEKFEGVFWIVRKGKRVPLTKNLVPGFKSYDESVVKFKGEEYRIWDPYRSKPAAAIVKGLRTFPIRRGIKILYLGIASGTTASHFSDIVRREGIIYGIEVAQRVMRVLLNVAATRRNIVPILASARDPEKYARLVEEVDVVYTDVSQRDEAEILVRNADMFLKDRGFVIIAIKASSIDVRLPPRKVYNLVENVLKENGYNPIEMVDLSPFDPKHAIIVAKKKKR